MKKTNDPNFFVAFKEWIVAHKGTISDRLFDRERPNEQCRGIIIEPPKKPIASVLFVHGTGNDMIYPSISLYKFLFSQGIRICAFDLDGHGIQGTTLFSRENAASFMSWAIAQTKSISGDPLFVIGHSLGGSLALAHAATKSNDLQGLILISAPLELSPTFNSLVREVNSVLRPSVWQERLTYGSLGILPAIGPFKRASYPIRLKNSESHYVVQVNETIKALRLHDKLDSISCPVLLIYGTGDYLVRESNAIDIQKLVKNSELFLIEGATHFSTILEKVVPEKISTFIRANLR